MGSHFTGEVVSQTRAISLTRDELIPLFQFPLLFIAKVPQIRKALFRMYIISLIMSQSFIDNIFKYRSFFYIVILAGCLSILRRYKIFVYTKYFSQINMVGNKVEAYHCSLKSC